MLQNISPGQIQHAENGKRSRIFNGQAELAQFRLTAMQFARSGADAISAN
jgi:hypothetical protein